MEIEDLEYGDVISFDWKTEEYSKTATFIQGVSPGWSDACIHSPI